MVVGMTSIVVEAIAVTTGTPASLIRSMMDPLLMVMPQGELTLICQIAVSIMTPQPMSITAQQHPLPPAPTAADPAILRTGASRRRTISELSNNNNSLSMDILLILSLM